MRCDADLPEFAVLEDKQAYDKYCHAQAKVGERVDPTHRIKIIGAGHGIRLEAERPSR
ncbi:hypothetical protein [Enemella dayhoffiae]|uniref:hypothetical protein n=1 Tax=Enemella dayhoffiae TaxID=2016507 RepID=UPI001595237A|nr:hypothetical protein [Enemella dayhoffiae]